MKPRSSIISVIASLIILFACFTQIASTSFIGDVNPTLDRSSRYESSYVVERFNSTHYQATNGTSGAVQFQSTDASYIMNSVRGTIFVKAGTYPVNNLALRNGTSIIGSGYNSTIFQLSGNANMFRNAGTYVDSKILLADLKLDGNRASYSGSGIVGGFSDLTLSRVWISDFSGWGVVIKGVAGKVTVQHLHMDFSHIRSCVSGGLYLGNCAADHVISNSYFISNGGSQVTMNVTNCVEFIGCHFAGAGQAYGLPAYGIHYNGTDASLSLRIVGCEFENIDLNAICLVANNGGDINRVVVSGNTFTAVGQETNQVYYVINCSNVHYGTFEGNTFNDIASSENEGKLPNYAIYITYGYENTISGNTVRGGYGGISISKGRSETIIGNTIRNCTYRGIYLYASENCSVTGNSVRDCYDYGIRLYQTNSSSFVGNTIVGNGKTGPLDGIGVGVKSSNNTITGNVARANKRYQINIESATCRNNIVMANTVDSTGCTGSINDVGTNSRVKDNSGFISPSDGQAFSYTVSKVGSNYFAVNGSSGLVDFGPSTNASYIIEKTAEKQNVTIYVKIGKYYINTSPIIRKSWVYFQGEGYGSEFIFTGANTGFRIEYSQYEIRNVEFHDLNFNGQGIAKYAINTTAIGDSNRSRLIKVSDCRFTGFYVAGASAIGLRNPELCTIEGCQFNYAAPNEGQISITSKSYYAGNVWVLNNFFYIGSDYSQGGFGVYIETLDSVTHKDFNTLWSIDNQYYSDPHHNGTAIWCNASQGSINIIKSLGDLTERCSLIYTEDHHTYHSTAILVDGATIFQECAGHKLIRFAENTSYCMVRNSMLKSNNATGGFFWDDDSLIATLGMENSFMGNTIQGVGSFGDSKYTRVQNNIGINPFAKKTTNYLVGSYLTAYGTATAFSYNYQYYMRTSDCLVTLVGGTSVNVTIYDSAGNVAWANCTSLTLLRIPYGYSFRAWWRTSISGIEFYWQ